MKTKPTLDDCLTLLNRHIEDHLICKRIQQLEDESNTLSIAIEKDKHLLPKAIKAGIIDDTIAELMITYVASKDGDDPSGEGSLSEMIREEFKECGLLQEVTNEN